MMSRRKGTGEMWVRSAGLQEVSEDKEAEDDQRNILQSTIKEYHQLKTGLFVRQKTLLAVVILSFVSERMSYIYVEQLNGCCGVILLF
jgi:uncharacterized protein (DUF2164 family)